VLWRFGGRSLSPPKLPGTVYFRLNRQIKVIADCGFRIAELKPEPSAASSAKLNPKQETRIERSELSEAKPKTSNQ
jgi:hypothetical protein